MLVYLTFSNLNSIHWITRGSAHWACIAHLTIEWYWSNFKKGHTQGPSMPSLVPFGQAVSEEKIFLTLANQKKELFLAAMFIGQMERNGETL